MNKKIAYPLAALGAAFAMIVLIVWLVAGNKQDGSEGNMTAYAGHGGTFKNTIVDMDTPDPSVVYKDGYYYMTFTHNGADIMVMKSRTIDFRQAERKVVWYPPIGTMYSANLWAPELQYIQGKWYIYFAADDGQNENHRMYALEALSDDPLGEYEFRGKIDDGSDKWAIDGLVMEHEDQLYFVWSGWEGDINISQNTYIAPMSDPLTISGPRVLLSEPTLDWERAGGPPYIQEGQAILKHQGRLFIAYSGAGSWTPFYSIGLLTLKEGGDPLQPDDWTKLEQPLMVMDEEAEVYGPGHNSFTSSPDGSETWIVYHATSGVHDGWSNRKARAQKVSWDEQGMPVFGQPLSLDTAIEVPSGEGVYRAEYAVMEEGKLLFDLIPSTVQGEMPVLLHYSGGGDEVILDVNGEEKSRLELPLVEGGEAGYAWASVPLEAGMNTLGIQAPEGTTIEAMELTRYEAEYGQAEGGAWAESNPFASGGGIASGAGEGTGAVKFANVIVPQAGEYQLRIAASNRSASEETLEIKLSGKQAARAAIPSSDRQFTTVTVNVKLRQGANEIVIDKLNESLAIDYIDILR
ncbi:family 43 glycosylhydrolase [Paenibacillus campinasensis]|uniref:Alpha-N-arabinofuranosidase n=1 Tax=Paenibacillus campinasensis TaxID=66347 RepID=A0A268ERL1_9BACL|nr:family 43 glycosylhydrolase [Paenibacillus campinasensis]MUG66258.1 family 43 glycosylhydrolase [Paenibacillus campinasensis]PAD75762.1 alpha-N-arabinofuranosidase [Paenibacillus campinasensis]